MKLFFLFSIALHLSCFSFPKSKLSGSDTIPVKGYKIFWKDEFDGNNLDIKKWGYHGLGKRRDAFNTKEAITLDGNGHLIIEAKVVDDAVITGIIHTEHLFATKYGYFECKAKLTKTKGIWPGFWLLSSTNADNGTPEKNGTEIDIFEYFMHDKKNAVCHTQHWGGYGATHAVDGPVWSNLKNTADGFHVFGLEWDKFSYSIFVDGVKTATTRLNISQMPEFILLSVEVDKQVAGPLNKTELPDKFIVDYVRVYKKK